MTENRSEDKEIVEPKILFCKQCRGIKVDDREYCSYCVGRHEVENSSFRVRLACRLLPSQMRYWFVFHLGYERQYEQLIPEHLREGKWLDIEQINAPIEEE